MTTETPTLNPAQRDGIRALREAANELAESMKRHRRADGTTDPVGDLYRAGVVLHTEPSRADVDGVIAWVDRQLRHGILRDKPFLRLLDDATALLRWVDGAL